MSFSTVGSITMSPSGTNSLVDYKEAKSSLDARFTVLFDSSFQGGLIGATGL